jgi:hypothetical protein
MNGQVAAADTFFASNWNTALGVSRNAISDGGKWENVRTHTVGGLIGGRMGPRCEVFPPDHACLMGNNYLSVWLDGIKWGGVWNRDFRWLKPEEDHVYWRLYVRVYPHHVPPTNLGFVYGHFVQSFQEYPTKNPNAAKSSTVMLGFRAVNATHWEIYVGSGPWKHHTQPVYPYDKVIMPARGSDILPLLKVNRWYRVEGHYHLFWNEAFEADNKWDPHVPCHLYLRVYDENGKLVADNDDLVLGERGNSKPLIKMNKWYARGNKWIIDGQVSSWMIGNNGPTSNGYGRAVDYAGLEIRHDRWCGPFVKSRHRKSKDSLAK